MSKPIKSSPDSQVQLELPDSPAVTDSLPKTRPLLPESIVLIDLENVQPNNIDALASLPFRVYVFAGENQSKISLDFAAALQKLGKRADYVQMSGNGPNALDFHIAFYIGELAAASPSAQFYIVSEDKGFDPLIKHLGNRKTGRTIRVKRVGSIANIIKPSTVKNGTTKKQIDTIVKNLLVRGPANPKTIKTLTNTINSLFAEPLSSTELADVLELLKERGYITVKGAKISYTLPRPK